MFTNTLAEWIANHKKKKKEKTLLIIFFVKNKPLNFVHIIS